MLVWMGKRVTGIPVTSMSHNQLVHISTEMTLHFCPPTIPQASGVLDFVTSVASLYKNNPYHNFRHAVDVTAATYSFLCNLPAMESMPPRLKSTLLLAAICHDMAHPGVNNKYVGETWEQPRWDPEL